jgi:heme-degrading monooxygenase HmoA
MPRGMFHCAILFRLKPGIPLDRVRGARESLAALVETLPGVEHFTVTHNVATDSHGYNLALFATFESQKACDIFLRHPEYQRVWHADLLPVVADHVTAQGQGA